MKKFLSLLLVLVLAFALVACGGAPAEENTTPAETEPEEVTEDPISVCLIVTALGDNSFADASDRSMKEYVDTYGIDYFCTQVGANGDMLTATRSCTERL